MPAWLIKCAQCGASASGHFRGRESAGELAAKLAAGVMGWPAIDLCLDCKTTQAREHARKDAMKTTLTLKCKVPGCPRTLTLEHPRLGRLNSVEIGELIEAEGWRDEPVRCSAHYRERL